MYEFSFFLLGHRDTLSLAPVLESIYTELGDAATGHLSAHVHCNVFSLDTCPLLAGSWLGNLLGRGFWIISIVIDLTEKQSALVAQFSLHPLKIWKGLILGFVDTVATQGVGLRQDLYIFHHVKNLITSIKLSWVCIAQFSTGTNLLSFSLLMISLAVSTASVGTSSASLVKGTLFLVSSIQGR